MSNLAVFQFESHEVRFVGTAIEPWWVAADVCAVLAIKNVGDALSRLDEDEKTDDIAITDAIGRTQSVWAINESGLYSLILTSRKAQAKRFKKWVTSEVLPSIRKTGKYELPQPEQPPTLPQPETKLVPPAVAEICDLIDLTLGKTELHPNLIAGVKLNAIATDICYMPSPGTSPDSSIKPRDRISDNSSAVGGLAFPLSTSIHNCAGVMPRFHAKYLLRSTIRFSRSISLAPNRLSAC
ncbi:Bro-N domain-containing protein [Nostoc sp. CHAB 5844]|nr:Bro-N domain-containing protein [Nostoc sp. CHAB 5844]